VLVECERFGLGFLPFFPLESGLLTGKIRAGQPVPEGTRLSNTETQHRFVNDERLATVEKLIAYAEGKGHTLLELAFSWLLAKPVVASVIAGATKPEQILANAAAPNWKLSAAELAEIDTLLG
jgi:aryl-alcohol dehydrogenase-like predicted oxidoreductase